jgi:regulator of extracellular matrix RemA (YlzA/DUF370 family)
MKRIILSGSLTLVMVAGVIGVSSQTIEHRTDIHSGYASVQGTSMDGHVSVGLHAAERVQGPTMHGWIGFYPVVRPIVSSVDDDSTPVLKIVPNPATEYCTIDHVNGRKVSVYTVEGQKVSVSIIHVDTTARLDVRDLPSGSYRIVIGSERTETVSLSVLH